MKQFISGLVVGILLWMPAAKALDVTLMPITVRDFMAGCALAGYVAQDKTPNLALQSSRDITSELCYLMADSMMKRRGK